MCVGCSYNTIECDAQLDTPWIVLWLYVKLQPGVETERIRRDRKESNNLESVEEENSEILLEDQPDAYEMQKLDCTIQSACYCAVDGASCCKRWWCFGYHLKYRTEYNIPCWRKEVEPLLGPMIQNDVQLLGTMKADPTLVEVAVNETGVKQSTNCYARCSQLLIRLHLTMAWSRGIWKNKHKICSCIGQVVA